MLIDFWYLLEATKVSYFLESFCDGFILVAVGGVIYYLSSNVRAAMPFQ